MKKIALNVILGYVRHAMTGIGGAMVAHGTMSGQQEQQIIGGTLALIGVLWSHYVNHTNATK